MGDPVHTMLIYKIEKILLEIVSIYELNIDETFFLPCAASINATALFLSVHVTFFHPSQWSNAAC